MVTDVQLTVVEGNDQVDRILGAAQALVARWGVAKTSVRDLAAESGISRATVYRVFPGGKQQVFLTLAHREVASYADAVADAIDSGDDLADAVTRGVVVAARLLRDHDAAQFVLAHEPGLFTPVLGFRGVDVLYREAADRLGPHLHRFVPADRAAWAVEWAARLFVSYVAKPDADADLADVEVTSRLVGQFLAPAFAAAAGDRSEPATEPATAPVATIH